MLKPCSPAADGLQTQDADDPLKAIEQMRLFVEYCPSAIAMLDRDMRYLLVSQEWQREFSDHCSPTVFTPDTFFAKTAPTWNQIYEQCLIHGSDYGSDEPYLRADGGSDWFRWKVRPWHHSDGAIGGVIIAAEKITQQKQTELALKQSEAIYRTLIENASDCVCYIDLEGKYRYINPGGVRLNELDSPDQIYGQDCTISLKADYREQMSVALDRARQGQATKLAYASVNAKGRELWWDSVVDAIRDDQGTIIGLLRAARNINIQKQAETQLKQLNESLGQDIEQGALTLKHLVNQLEQEVQERKQTEEELRQSQQRLELLIQQSPIAVIEWNHRFEVIQWNLAAETIFGYTREEALSRRLDFLVPEVVREYVDEIVTALLSQQGGAISINQNITKDGRTITCEWHNSPLIDGNGNLVGVVSLAIDITQRVQAETERKQTEVALCETRKFLESVLDNLPVAVFAKEASDLRFVLWNPAARELLGYESDAVIGKNDYDFFPAAQADFFIAKDREVLSSGKVVEIPEEKIQTARGETRILQTTKTTITDSDGNPRYLLAIAEDISERKWAEAQLREQEQFLRSIFDGVDCSIFVVDVLENGEFLYASHNHAAEKKTGQRSADVAGKHPGAVFGEAEGVIICQFFSRCVEASATISEVECLTFDGKQAWVKTTLNPLFNEDGRIYRIVGTSFDISDLKRAQAKLKQQAVELSQTLEELQRTQFQMVQAEKMSSLGQLVAGVAHEINNPVNFIFGNLNYANDYTRDLLRIIELFQKHYPSPHPEIEQEMEAIDLDFLLDDLPKLLSSMKVGAERIQKIVASLRTFSRMDEAEMKEVNIHEGIDSTLMILQNRIKAKHDRPEIQITKAYGELPQVECFAGQLNQVFMNLLSNAIDALDEAFTTHPPTALESSEAAIAPTITICTQLREPEQLHISIRDNGTGIPDAIRQRLFDPFFTTKPVGKGTGMGLSISYQIVTEKHGGSLSCQSEPGQGAEFIIQIPLHQKGVANQ